MWSKYPKEFQILYERISERERKKVEEGEKAAGSGHEAQLLVIKFLSASPRHP